MSVQELLITQILNSYNTLTEAGCIPKVIDYTERSLNIFHTLLNGEIGLIVKNLVRLNFDEKIQ